MARKLTKYELGIREFFGKRYMWLLDSDGRLGLHKVNDKGAGTDQGSAHLKELLEKQAAQAE